MGELTCPRGHPVGEQDTICAQCGHRLPPRPRPAARKADDAPTTPTLRGEPGADPFGSGILGVDVHVTSSLGERQFTLPPDSQLELGREVGPLTDLCPDNISSQHAELVVGDDAVTLRDTGRDRRGSTNGTFVDGTRLKPDVPVILADVACFTLAADPPMSVRIKVNRP